MLVRQVMNRSVVIVKPELTLKEACDVMSKLRIGSLVVLSDQKLLGIVTSMNIMKSIASGRDPEKTLVDNIMTKEIITVGPDKDLQEAVDLMVKNKIKKLPVLDSGKLVGMITTSDIISVEPKMLESIASLLSVKPPMYTGG